MLNLHGPRLSLQTLSIFFESCLSTLRSSSNVSVAQAARLIYEQILQNCREDVVEAALSHILHSVKRSNEALTSMVCPKEGSPTPTPTQTSNNASKPNQASSREHTVPIQLRSRQQELVNLILSDISLLVFAFLRGKLTNLQRERVVHVLGEHSPNDDRVVSYNPEIQLALLAAFRHMSTKYVLNHPQASDHSHLLFFLLTAMCTLWY